MFEHRRTARLPFGFACEFVHQDDCQIRMLWSPSIPVEDDFEPEDGRRFMRAYREARDEFLKECATIRGQRIELEDFRHYQPVGDVVTIEPAVRH
jgi:hypothetical protein